MTTPRFDIGTFDVERAEAPATRMELYLVARMLQNYVLASKNEILVVLSKEGSFHQIAHDRVEKFDQDLHSMLNGLITAASDEVADL